uniref:Zinc finger protein 704 n=1 Tax=Tetraodon nigroviridis TaxID=99883 RepID=H3DK88_TETNG
MDKVTAAMVLTSLSTSPLVKSPPAKVNGPPEGLNGSWKDSGSGGPFTPSSNSSSGGYWSWSAPSDQSNPSTPSPPLSADSFNLLFDEPIPRKRKNSMKVMFKCLWKNCGKVLSTAAGIQRHIRTIHLGRNCELGLQRRRRRTFYYTEIKLNTDSVADGLSSLSPPLRAQRALPHPHGPRLPVASLNTPPRRRCRPAGARASASSVPTPSPRSRLRPEQRRRSGRRTPTSPPPPEENPHPSLHLFPPPRSRKVRGEGKNCRKVYGMENRDMWCTACRWKKACQRFTD